MTRIAFPHDAAHEVAVDDNLPLPADFAERTESDLAEFHELERMMDAFGRGDAAAMFSPVGLLPALADAYDVGYQVVAQAVVGPERSPTLTSRLMVRADSGATRVEDVLGGRLARVNAFCTTSFWAPLVSLLGRVPDGTVVRFADCAGFLDMVRSVVDGRNDAAMVWDVILARAPELAAGLRPLDLVHETLPAPVVLVRDDAPEERARLARILRGYSGGGGETFFSGLDAPDMPGVDRFRRGMAEAVRRFRIDA